MNGDSARIAAIHATEQRFWRLISEEDTINGGGLRYKPKDKLSLREADKLVVAPDEHLHEYVRNFRPQLLRLLSTPAHGDENGEMHRLSERQLLSLFDGIVFQPYNEASLYLWADDLKNLPPENPHGIDVIAVADDDGHDQFLRLRTEKDRAITDESVRASLRTWVLRRMESIPGYTSLLLQEFDSPIGMLSYYRETDAEIVVTRVRDLFILPAYQSRGYSKYLFKHLASASAPPYSVVTDLGNKALFQYRQRGFRPLFVQEVYQLVQYRLDGGAA